MKDKDQILVGLINSRFGTEGGISSFFLKILKTARNIFIYIINVI